MKKLNIIGGIVLLMFLLLSCSDKSQKRPSRTDTKSSGLARIAVDECLAPVIQHQVNVFEGTYPEAAILPSYTSEREAYKLFNSDSIRLVIGTRELTDAEKAKVRERGLELRSQPLAVDAIALIVNKNNPDTLMTEEELRKIMTGEITSWKELNPNSKLGDISVAFDTPNSSTARFINDSITNKVPFGENVRAVGEDTQSAVDIQQTTPNQQVIDYVKANKNALGVVGVNWIANPRDSLNLSFSPEINVVALSNKRNGEEGKYYKPYPAFMALQWYPLTRNVYIIISDIRSGLPAGFVGFAAGEKGQRIILKSGLLPATAPTRVVRTKPMSEL